MTKMAVIQSSLSTIRIIAGIRRPVGVGTEMRLSAFECADGEKYPLKINRESL
jgi:hypothetical protein